MKGEYCVYRHNCPDGRVYIGITSQAPGMRWNGGLGYQSSNWEFFKYILAVGWNNIEHEILYMGLTESEAREIEKDEILKAGNRVFNRMCAPKLHRAIPEDTKREYEELSELEQYCVDLWADALFGNCLPETRYLIIARPIAGWTRTVQELSSGDPEKVTREMEFIEKHRKSCLT